MRYGAYEWHSGSASRILTPRRTKGNIKGIELEIGNRSACSEVSNTLDAMIDEGVLTAPGVGIGTNIASPTVISNDGSVYKELIIKACSKRRLLSSVKTLSEYLGGVTENERGTSCHIHYNDAYLRTRGIQSYDMFKTAEFLAPILFRISERDLNSCGSWAHSHVGDIDDPNLYKRARSVDSLNGQGRDSRYSIINCRRHTPTTELRIFSNHCDFDYDTIKFYIDTSDFIIDVCDYMIGKSFEDEAENIVKMAKKFFTKKNTINFYNKYRLEDFFKSKKHYETERLNKIKEKIINDFEQLIKNKNRYDTYEQRIRLCRILRNLDSRFEIPEIEINFEENDIERNRDILIDNIENEIANL